MMLFLTRDPDDGECPAPVATSFVREHVSDRAIEFGTKRRKGTESDGFGVIVFQDREIDGGDAHTFCQFHKGYVPILKKHVQVASNLGH
jgi:hypothetical protein